MAHCLTDQWVAVAAGRAASNAPDPDPDRALAVALGSVDALFGLCDEAVRIRGANGYLAGDVAAEGRAAALDLARRLGDRDDILEHLGRPGRSPLRTATDTDRAVEELLGAVWTDERRAETDAAGGLHDPDVHRLVADAGWLGVFVAHARLDPDQEPVDAFAIAEALTVEGIPVHALNTTAMVAALTRDLGSPHLVHEVLPELLAGREISALGYTEPQGGSDLAAVATVGVAVDPERWRLTGVKRHCTLADIADHVLVLARTDPDSRRHKGLTLFLVPNGLDGMSVTPLRTHGGESTTELVLDGVLVGRDHVLGEVGEGWRAAMTAMRYERNATPWGDGLRLLALADDLGAASPDGTRLADRPGWRRAVGHLYLTQVLGRGLVEILLADAPDLGAAAPSAVKLYTTETLVAGAGRLVRAVPSALAGDARARSIESLWRRAVSLTIAGGPSEVQRDVLATQVLELPRH